jgi:hypothetical protein
MNRGRSLQIWSPTFSKAFDDLPSGIRETVQRKIDEMGMEAGVSNHVWDLSELVALIDAAEESVKLAA